MNDLRTMRILSTLVGLFLGRPLPAQTITPISPEIHNYASPMTLEINLDYICKHPGLPRVSGVEDSRARTTSGAPMIVAGTQNYSCRGVEIAGMNLQFVRIMKKRVDEANLKIMLDVFNNSVKDKKAVFAFELLKGESLVTSATMKMRVPAGDFAKAGRGSVEGQQHIAFPVTLPGPPFDLSPIPRLRMTVTLTDY